MRRAVSRVVAYLMDAFVVTAMITSVIGARLHDLVLAAVWALVDRRHQAVHDKVARTEVVRAPSAAH